MGFTNYLTSYKVHLLKHIRGVFAFHDTTALTEAEVKACVSRMVHESAVPIPSESYEWLSNYFRYVQDKGEMLVYDNTRGLWRFEDGDATMQSVLTDYFTVIAEEAGKTKDVVMIRYANHFFGVGKIQNLVRRIKHAIIFTIPKSSQVIEKTEQYRYFKTETGRALIDMSKGFNITEVTFQQTQDMLLQHIAPIPMAMDDDEPELWLELIRTYMMDDPERIAYFEKVLAYMMAPYNYNQVWLYFIGDKGRNGKSTVLKVLQDILGPHAIRMNSELLNAQPQSSFKKDDALAATEGRSLLIFNEIDERMQASTQNIKDITEGGRDEFGNKIMTVLRPAYSRNYEVNICGTPLIVANSLLNFSDWATIEPIFKRLVIVPFDYVIQDEDPHILNRLAAEYPKIQRWLYKNYFKHKGVLLKSVPKPPAIAQRFIEYREDSDIIKLFWDDCVEFTGGKDEMLRSDLYRMYEQYCKANGRKSIKNKGTNGFQHLVEPYLKNVVVVRKNGSYYVQGLKKSTYFEKEVI